MFQANYSLLQLNPVYLAETKYYGGNARTEQKIFEIEGGIELEGEIEVKGGIEVEEELN